MRSFLSFFCFLILVSASASSCRREEHTLTDAEVSARIDSVVTIRQEDAVRRSAEDLDRRTAIEVKVKTGSILEARRNGAAPAQAQPPRPTALPSIIPPAPDQREP